MANSGLKLTVPNSFFHLVVAFIVAAFVVGAFAYIVLPGAVPNPGHDLSTIQGYFQGDASLLQSLAKLQQQVTVQCAAGSSIRVINPDGTVSCEADDTGPVGLDGSGIANYLAKWNAATTLANSVLYENSGNIGIGTLAPTQKLDVVGNVRGTQLCIGADCRAAWPAGTSLPVGVAGQTLRNDGTNWIANSVLFNNGTNVGIGTNSPGTKLEVAGQVKITGGSPSAGKVLTSDASGLASWQAPVGGGDITSVSAGTGLTGGGASGDVTLNANTAYLQRRVTGTCASNQAIRVVNANGTVSCVNIPSAAICTWGSKTYSTGAACWPGSCSLASGCCTWVCQADGSWVNVMSGINCQTVGCCGC